MTKEETIKMLQSIEDRAVDFPYMTACDWVAIAAAKRHLENSIEVKEVDLDKEFNKYFITNNLIAADIQFEPVTQMKKCAKYFFELGTQANNPITAADRGTAEEIIVNLKRVELDYHIDLTREMEWVRNKAKKGE